jgi:crotonobetainyl-CoA:carnitine CoA-transferase CaiB-like acyl-CoA transferase
MLPTADGHVFVMCMKPSFWQRFCAAIGRPDLPADARFAGYRDRLANRDALMAEVDAAMRAKPNAHWIAALGGKVPVAPVLSLGEALDNPHFRQRGGAQVTPHPTRPDFMLVANPIRLDGEVLPARAAPGYGADTDDVLAEAGFDGAEIAALRAAKVV